MKQEKYSIEKEHLYVASDHSSIEVTNTLLGFLRMDEQISAKFEIINIGAQYSFSEKQIKKFTALRIGNLIAKNVKEDKHRGIIISGTGGGANLFAAYHKHIRPCPAYSPEHAKDLRQKMIMNVMSVASCHQKPEDVLKNAKAFLLNEPTKKPKDRMQTIKVMTNRGDYATQLLWIYMPGVMKKLRLFSR